MVKATSRADIARQIIDLYGEKVKPPSLDTSRVQAVKNVVKLLKAGESEAGLRGAIANYVTTCEKLGSELKYRKNAGNFFGREQVYQGFLPGVYPTSPDTLSGGPKLYAPPEPMPEEAQ